MKLWKWLGLAGIAGVAATGAIIARDQRRRAQLAPEQVRARLHERYAQVQNRSRSGSDGEGPPT
ncbi:MAG: hypothetical protein ACLGH4_04185 [Actinomycetes bacterium]